METGFYLLICGGGTVDNRSQPMPYTSNNNSNNGHGLDTISNDHILVPALQRFLTFSSLQMSISNTGRQQQFLHPSQVPPSAASQPHNHSLLLAAGSTWLFLFMIWGDMMTDAYFSDVAFSGLPLSRCLLLFISLSSNPPSFFFSSVAFHRFSSSYETKKKGYLFLYSFFWCQSFLLYFKESGRCRSFFVMPTINNIRNS